MKYFQCPLLALKMMKKHQEMKIKRKKDDRLPTIKEEEEPVKPKEQIAELDKFYGRDLIYKYFFENYLTKIINKLKNY